MYLHYFSKMLFIKIPFRCTYPNSLGLKTKDEPRMNQGTTKELRTTKKCFLLRLLPKKVVCIPKKVDSFPEKVYSFPETVDLSI